MASGGAFGGARGLQPVAPEKGVFPLDHFGECKQAMDKYMACLRGCGGRSEECRDVAKEYLQCRMEKNLMAKQELSELGFTDAQTDEQQQQPQQQQTQPLQGTSHPASSDPKGAEGDADSSSQQPKSKQATGFVAGIRRR